MSEQEDNAIDIYLEKQSIYDLEGKYGEDAYTLKFNFGCKPTAVRDLLLQDLENLYDLLGKVLAIEQEYRTLTANPTSSR